MTDTDMYWQVRGPYATIAASLSSRDRGWLEAAILDAHYNSFLCNYANYSDEDEDRHGHGKCIPYIGWFWRHIEFSDIEHIPIGDCGAFIGFMVKNKWDYPERYMTPTEARAVIAIIDEAITAPSRHAKQMKLADLWKFMQTLKIVEDER